MMKDVWKRRRVLVTGAGGFVGRNLVPLLERTGCELFMPTRQDYDLLEQEHVRRLLADVQPQVVFHLAGRVGGIMANRERPADFFYENLMMGTALLHESWQAGVEKYVTLIGGCCYPANAPSPIAETELWNGYPRAESAPYALAKSMSVLQARSYRQQYGFDAIVLVPGNLYGPFDNFDLDSAHVIPALIRKFHEATVAGQREVIAWGSGAPVRDFVFVEDACEAILLASVKYSGGDIINLSSGVPTTIRALVDTVAELMDYQGTVRWDTGKPNGQMLKGFEVARMHDWLGYQCKTSLREGLGRTIAWWESQLAGAGASYGIGESR